MRNREDGPSRRDWFCSCTAVGVAFLQLLLGWRMQQTTLGNDFIGPVVDIAMCMLLLGCVQSSTMTLFNHIGVSTMGSHAYSVRAAGSAGYMVALLLMGSFGSSAESVAEFHLFIGATISMCHALFAFLAWRIACHVPQANLDENCARSISQLQAPFWPKTCQSNKLQWSSRSHWSGFGLLLLVWMVAVCEMSYGLYAHEFLTTTYGNYGYFVFAGAVAIEIAVLIALPFVPA